MHVEDSCVSSLGQFHMVELGSQVAKRGALMRLYAVARHFLVKMLQKDQVRMFRWVYTSTKVLERYGLTKLTPKSNFVPITSFDDWVTRPVES